MKFSERHGFKPISQQIQKESMTPELRNSIWNVLDLLIWRSHGFQEDYFDKRGVHQNADIYRFGQTLWFSHFKKPLDSLPKSIQGIFAEIRKYFFSCQWFEVYDFIEFVLIYDKRVEVSTAMNEILEREFSGFRFIGGYISPLTSEQEIESVNEALDCVDFPNVKTHLLRALELFSNRTAPDYRNSIKESISAVESMAQTITGSSSASLGDALKTIETKHKLHKALKESFSKLYGYTSDADGIRHALSDETQLGHEDARFFLISCSAFINYLKAKIE